MSQQPLLTVPTVEKTSGAELLALMADSQGSILKAGEKVKTINDKLGDIRSRREAIKKQLKSVAKEKKKADKQKSRQRKKMANISQAELYEECLWRKREELKRMQRAIKPTSSSSQAQPPADPEESPPPSPAKPEEIPEGGEGREAEMRTE